MSRSNRVGESGSSIYSAAPSFEAASEGRGVLRLGHQGAAVKELQLLLKSVGYDVDPDKYFGPETDAALRDYQTKVGLDLDGKAGPSTIAALKRDAALLKDKASPATDGVAESRPARNVVLPDDPTVTTASRLTAPRNRPSRNAPAGSINRDAPTVRPQRRTVATETSDSSASTAATRNTATAPQTTVERPTSRPRRDVPRSRPHRETGPTGSTTTGATATTTTGATGNTGTTTTTTTTAATTAAMSFAPAAGRAAAAFAADQATRLTQAEALLKANGLWPPAAGQVLVVQIDQDSPPPPPARLTSGSAEDRRENARLRNEAQSSITQYLHGYTGQTIILRAERDAAGEVKLVELNKNGPYRSASHAGQHTTRNFTDFDGNGTSDIATLRAGAYQYRGRAVGERFNPVSDRPMKVGRDLNQDGVISASESQRTANAYGTSMQWHAGTAGGPISVGCQNIPPDQYREFMRTINAERQESFTYLLVRRPNDTTGEYTW